MWEFYLAACEVVFRNGTQMVFQIQLAHNKYAVPRTRDYLYAPPARVKERSRLPSQA
jgi:cyclopropane-fatty-acyl-phospholipid synthase